MNRTTLRCWQRAAMLAMAVLAGCALPVAHQDLVPIAVTVANPHPQSVSVTAVALPGKDEASADALQAALVQALAGYKVFAGVKPAGGEYALTVRILAINTPAFSGGFTTRATLGWTLTRAATGAVVWQETISSDFAADSSRAPSGVERQREATAGALRINLRDGLTRLGALQLRP